MRHTNHTLRMMAEMCSASSSEPLDSNTAASSFQSLAAFTASFTYKK